MFVYYFWERYVFGTNVAFVCGVVIVSVVIEGVGVVEEGVEGLDFLVDDCVCCCFRLGWREVTLVFSLVVVVIDVKRCLKLNWLIVVIITIIIVIVVIIVKMTRYICFIIYVSYTYKIFLCCCT